MVTLLVLVFLLALAAAAGVFLLWRQLGSLGQGQALAGFSARCDALDQSLSHKLASSQADMAGRLEQAKGDLRQQVSDRLETGFTSIRDSLEQHLAGGRREQAAALSGARQELTTSLSATTAQLKIEFDGLNRRTADSLEAIRMQVDAKLLAITDQVQQKLDQNIREGFAQFEKVQQHLKAAEEQLRQVGTLGESINDLNNLLKLPHLRGQFGEASLERLLSDFLPAHMFDLQSSPGEGGGRADAMINLPDRRLPIDAKFPREQVLALFESSNEAEIDAARERLSRVMKTEARRIKAYIQPENGTTDIALMYLPSETLYLETIRDRELSDWLNQQHVFPVSPNTLLMTLQTIALVHKWYEVASRFEQTRLELGKAQKSFDHFQAQFETVGKSLNKAQEAFDTAAKHLKSYRGKVTVLSGQEQLDLDAPRNNGHALAEKAGA
jgi:DNA recombination protein RmuC